MIRTYVAIDDPLHHRLREFARRTPLVCATPGAAVPVLEYSAPQPGVAETCAAMVAGAPDSGSGATSSPSGRRIGFDVRLLDQRCCRDLRLRLNPAGLVAAELLVFGTGTLRARNDNPGDPLHQFLLQRYGRLHPRHEVVWARLRTLHRHSLSEPGRVEKETFDSTNVIYGDAYGELEQLWERRADTTFLDEVARSLRGARRRGRLAGFVQPPLHLAALLQLHFRAQALWKSPPQTGRGLLRRLEFILDHILVDSWPCTLVQKRGRAAAPPDGAATDWRADVSGYDGWLGGASGAG